MAEVTNSFGEVPYGAAVPVQVPDYTSDMLAGMRQQQAREDEAVKDAIRRRRERQERLSKTKADLNKFVFTNQPPVLPIREEELKSNVATLLGYMSEKSKDKSWDPDTDKEYSRLYQEVQTVYNNRGEEYKNYVKTAQIPLDDKNQGKYDVNHDYFQAAMGKDPEKAARALAKFNTGDESRWEEYDAAGYLGVGALKAKDVTPWDTNTIKYVNSMKLPQKGTDIGGGKVRTIEGLSAEEIQKAADDFMLGEGGKNAQSLTVQEKANRPSFSIDEGQKIVRGMFVDRLTQRVKDNLKGGSQRMSEGQKNEEKLFFSPYTTKGAEGGAPGFNVGFIGGNKGLKADLQYGKEVLKDVDLKTIYMGKDGKLKAIVMQYDYEERPMTDDEKKKEKQSAAAQMREPVFTKTSRVEKPREIDFEVGSNNYNTIIAQYPGVEAKVTELTSPKPKGAAKEAKTVARAKVKALVGTKGYEGYSEKELVDYYVSQGYTVK